MPRKFQPGFTLGRWKERPRLFGPDGQIELRLWVTEHPVGAVLALGLGIYLWIALPEFRFFLVGAVALGVVIGLVLWLKHR